MSVQSRQQHSVIKLILLGIVLAIAIAISLNRQWITDQLRVWQFKPTDTISAISERAQLNERGKFLFYTAWPQIDGRDAFNSHCRQLVEKTAVLGCYVNQRIYIFDVTDTQLDGIKEVTAAHEMLHVAYDRLSTSERQHIDSLIEKQSASITDEKLRERLALYDKTEPGERLNELHSILGTEITALSPELETYYSRYFTNRSALVALSNQYEKVFSELEAKQKALIESLNTLSAEVSADTDSYTRALETLKADITNFNKRAQDGSFSSQSQFTYERGLLITQQERLQQQRSDITAKIDSYNAKKAELDTLNTAAEGLQKSINSSQTPEVPTL